MSAESKNLEESGSKVTVHFFQYGHTACLIGDLPKDWPPNHQHSPVPEEVNCPCCLQGMKYGESSYEILEDGKKIRCRRCGSISSDPNDVEQHYCGRCHASHDDIWPPARLSWIQSYAIPS